MNVLKAYKYDSSTGKGSSTYSFVNVIAYDDNENLINGNWSLVETDGGYFLNNSAIPEPATFAGLFGVLALILAMRRKN